MKRRMENGAGGEGMCKEEEGTEKNKHNCAAASPNNPPATHSGDEPLVGTVFQLVQAGAYRV